MPRVKKEIAGKLKDLHKALRKRGIKVTKIILYGSRASGRYHKDSDIDVAVASPDVIGCKQRVYMRTHHFFRISWKIFILCIIAISASLAQEDLPALVKKVQPSTFVIFTYNKEGKVLGQASGFFISKYGNAVTNRHVLEGANSADAKTADGKMFSIKRILAEDKKGDLIIVLVDVNNTVVAPLVISDSLPEVGEQVIVIGSPFGLEKTVSDGIVSAVREIPTFGKIIQITAPISPGSSGSPVVNIKGEVIGVATFQLVEGQNLNFAIPGDKVAKLSTSNGQSLAEWEANRAKEWAYSAEGLYDYGYSLLMTSEYEKALPYFEKAVKKNPLYADAYFYLGYTNSKLGYLEEAVKAYTRAISIRPYYVQAHYNLGLCYLELKDIDSAFEEYKILRELDKDLSNNLLKRIGNMAE